ncbi:hypothetical protein L596_015984 [Steinernema carpocapsae]|uniref:Uncharacterized protein n=1 Tax=Steinernema carpocapsae TaxID=34508 RepID=A0A4U5NGM8_STECR|nr:hypothetical protein L596_015984 [Steinernema carpocapsae]
MLSVEEQAIHPGRCGKRLQVNSNVLNVRLPASRIYHYHIDVVGHKRCGPKIVLSRSFFNDSLGHERRTVLVNLFNWLAYFNEERIFAQPRNFLFYLNLTSTLGRS